MTPNNFATVRDILRYAITRFNTEKLFFGHGTNNAFDEAAYLILHTLKLPLDQLEPFLDARLLQGEIDNLLRVVDRRTEDRIPAAYITKEAWLGGYRFYVDERVIVPRSFLAELIPEYFAPWIQDPATVSHALDLCTGSGCLPILLAINLVESDLYSKLPARQYDLIISNPPYVNAESMRKLPQEYLQEPQLALAGGQDGMDLVRQIVKGAAQRLTPQGVLLVEIGNERVHAEAAFPELELTWVSTSAGDDMVFLVTAEQLQSLA